MNIKNPDLIIVRGINETWLKENFSQMWIGFGSGPIGIPKEDSCFVGLYIAAPVSAIKYIGVVSQIDRDPGAAHFYIKALIEHPAPINPGHPIRKHEYWDINQFNLNASQIDLLRRLTSF